MNNQEKVIKGLSQMKWQKFIVETGMDKINLSQDVLSFMRVAFEAGFNDGQVAMMDVIRDVYFDNPDLLDDFFEIDETLMQ